MVTDERLENLKGRVVGLAKMERWQKSELERQTPDPLIDGVRQMKIKLSETLISEYDDLAEALTELLARRKANEPMPEVKQKRKGRPKGVRKAKMRVPGGATNKQKRLGKWIADTLKLDLPTESTYSAYNQFIKEHIKEFNEVKDEAKGETTSENHTESKYEEFDANSFQ